MTQSFADVLSTGREALARGRWAEARAAFEESLKQEQTPEAFEGLSWACWWQSDPAVMFEARERAYQLYRKHGDRRGAARMAIWLASDYVDFRGQFAIANGWRQRARRLLKDLDAVPEYGWLLMHEGAIAIEIENDPVTAKRLGAETGEFGRRHEVIDLEVIGMAMQGLALVSEGQVIAGTRLLDEAMAVAVSGELEQPFSIGWVTCYLIYACERMRDFERAAQWCEKMEELAERLRFRFWFGICGTHYASVLTWQGKWNEAEAELVTSTMDLQTSRPPYAAEGMVRLAELRRLQGRLHEAAALFAQAEGHPLALLGSAELALDQDDPNQAEGLVQRFLRQTPEENIVQRAPAFELLVRTYVALGDTAQALLVLETLQSVAATVATQPLLASAAFAAGLVAVATADYRTACHRFEDTVDLFQRSGAPYEAGRARIELASVLYALGRVEAARKEAHAAQDALQSIGARREAERAAAFLQRWEALERGSTSSAPSLQLTAREVQILQLVAQGLGDREIATHLTISEHTVHRHISNILTKLDVPSRAAAVAYAARYSFI